VDVTVVLSAATGTAQVTAIMMTAMIVKKR